MGPFIGNSNTTDFGSLIAAPLDGTTRAPVTHSAAGEATERREPAPQPRSRGNGRPTDGGNPFVDIPPALACFEDELSALAYFEKIVWPNGRVCPRCGLAGRIGRLDGRSTKVGTFKCYACRRNFSITRGTIFDSTHVPLHKWMQAIYLSAGSAGSVRASQLARIIDVSFKTAVRMMKKLEDAAVPAALEPDTAGKSADGAPVNSTPQGGASPFGA
jgi:transposase-like protein